MFPVFKCPPLEQAKQTYDAWKREKKNAKNRFVDPLTPTLSQGEREQAPYIARYLRIIHLFFPYAEKQEVDTNT